MLDWEETKKEIARLREIKNRDKFTRESFLAF